MILFTLFNLELLGAESCHVATSKNKVLLSIIDWAEAQSVPMPITAAARLVQAKALSNTDFQSLIKIWDHYQSTFNYPHSEMNRQKKPNGLSPEVLSTLVMASAISLKSIGELLAEWDSHWAHFNFAKSQMNIHGKANALTPEIVAMMVLGSSLTGRPTAVFLTLWDFHYTHSGYGRSPKAIAALVLASALTHQPLPNLIQEWKNALLLFRQKETSSRVHTAMTEATMAQLILSSHWSGKTLNETLTEWREAFVTFQPGNPLLTGEILAELLARKQQKASSSPAHAEADGLAE